MALRGDEAGADDGFYQVFVVATKGVHLKASADTEYKRSVFGICGKHARRAYWAALVPAMRSKVMRFRDRGRVAGAAERDAVSEGGVMRPAKESVTAAHTRDPAERRRTATLDCPLTLRPHRW